jgi:peptide-methionine (S)-S-oxide reductase
MQKALTLTLLTLALVACGAGSAGADAESKGGTSEAPPVAEGMAVATFAGGCFWCMEPPFDKIDGVGSTTSGYIGGDEQHPTYKDVSAGRTHHAEAVRIVYDPAKVSYEDLLYVFWRNIDPTTDHKQFCDWGDQYRTAIFYHDETQKAAAEASKRDVSEHGKLPGPVLTEIEPAGKFWVAEEYHQDFYEKSPLRYKSYRTGCGRDARLEQLWGDEAGGTLR